MRGGIFPLDVEKFLLDFANRCNDTLSHVMVTKIMTV